MARLPTPPLKALDQCARPGCGHDRADHLPRCTMSIFPATEEHGGWCRCDSFMDTALTQQVPQPKPARKTDPPQEAP